MTLSARDKQIFSTIEQEIARQDPRWAARFERLAQPDMSRLRRRLAIGVTVLTWVALFCADAAHGPGPWLWGALAATMTAVTLLCLRFWKCRRRRK